MSERRDDELGALLKAARPEPREGWRERALARMRPARSWSAQRMVAAAVGVVALVGLGFVPVPMGEAPGALARALAAMEEATTVHVTTTWWTDEGETMTEEWSSDDGFLRTEYWGNGQLTSLTLSYGAWVLSVAPGGLRAEERFVPALLHPADPMDSMVVERLLDELRLVARRREEPTPEFDVREWRQGTMWGGAVDILEVEWTAESDQSPGFGHFCPKGTRVLVHAEMDPGTGRLLSVSEHRLEGRRWDQTYSAIYEWDIEIDPGLMSIALPSGTELTRYSWWENRAGNVVAQADTRDWTVTLHAIDIQRNGDVVLSLSRVETPDSEMPLVYNTAPPLVVQAVGSAGEQYEQQSYYTCANARHSGYWTTTLKPLKPHAHPRAVTLTVWPYAESPSEDQYVTFSNIPLPPRHDTDDLFAAETEVIQY